jgi:hypothetical protein
MEVFNDYFLGVLALNIQRQPQPKIKTSGKEAK